MQIFLKIVMTLFLIVVLISIGAVIWSSTVDLDRLIYKYLPLKKKDQIAVNVSPLMTTKENLVFMELVLVNLGSTDVVLNSAAVIFSPIGPSANGRLAIWNEKEPITIKPDSPVTIKSLYGNKQNDIYSLSSSFSGQPFQVNLILSVVTSQGKKHEETLLDIGRMTVKPNSIQYSGTSQPFPVILSN